MTNDELKPCPFCGGKAELKATDNGKEKHVACSVCHARSGDYYATYKDYAIQDWNTRTPDNCPNSDELRTALANLLLSIRDVVSLLEP